MTRRAELVERRQRLLDQAQAVVARKKAPPIEPPPPEPEGEPS